jgi:DNA-binding protein
MQSSEKVLDDRGTSQPHAVEILETLRDQAFEGSDEKLAIALGRNTEEIKRWIDQPGEVDADVLIKARGIALQRGIEVD